VEHAIAGSSKTLVVGDDYRGQALRSMDLLEQAVNTVPGLAVQISSRFVGE
jgi:hypothetical protein